METSVPQHPISQHAQRWWAWALRGAAAILFGVGVLVWPKAGLVVLVALFGAFALVSGIFALIDAAQTHEWNPLSWLLVIEGLLGIAAGIVTLVWPGITAVALLLVIAFWAVLTGIVELVAAFRFHRELGTGDAWLVGLGGVASVVFGVLLVAIGPAAGLLALVWLVGFYAIVFGTALLVFAFRLKAVQDRVEERLRGGITHVA